MNDQYELVLEIEEIEICRTQPADNKEMYRVADNWRRLMEFFGVENYRTYKLFKSKLNYATNRWEADTDNSASEGSTEGLQRMDNIYL